MSHDNNSKTNGSNPNPFQFPTLPIVTPDPPRRSTQEKYGSLFYLGIGGLIVVIALVSWFAWSAWAIRNVWANIYILHDPSRTERDRITAAYDLSRDPAVNQRQLWDIALRRPLPPLARYIIAESLTADAALSDPRAYGVAVAKSEGWPVWLRLLLTRPMALAAALDLPIDRDSLLELSGNEDQAIALWATFALAVGPSGDKNKVARLEEVASENPIRPLADLFLKAIAATEPERLKFLADATIWQRTHLPETAKVWSGYEVEANASVARPSKLRSHQAAPTESAAPN